MWYNAIKIWPRQFYRKIMEMFNNQYKTFSSLKIKCNLSNNGPKSKSNIKMIK